MRGREIIFCTIFFLVGNCLGGWVPAAPLPYLLLAAVSASLALSFRNAGVILLCFLLLGVSGVQIDFCIQDDTPSAIASLAFRCKRSFSLFLERFVPPGDELAVLKALAIGDKSDISRDLRQTYREAGAMHLLALSGLHVGIIYGIAVLALSFLGGSTPAKVFRSSVTLLFLWGYAVVSGLSPSICRAVVMITVYEISVLATNGRDGLTSLAVSALLITLFSPAAPRNIGFQLSYSAVLAIHTIHPRLNGLLDTKSRLLKAVWGSLSIAISCQATCGVLGWLYFGTFPRYFLLTNLLAVPLATVVMYLIAAGLLSWAIPGLNGLTALLIEKTILLLNDILAIIGSLSGQ